MAKFKMLPNGTVFEDLIESQTITPATSYNDLSDKPAINSVEIKGNKTSAQLGLMGKDEAYIKEEVDELIANIERGLTYKVVEELPTTGIDTRTIYLVPDEEDEGVMQQYLYISNDWVSLGSTEIDLSDYFTKSEINSKLVMRVPVQQATADAGKVLKVGSTGLVDVYPLNLYQHVVRLLDSNADTRLDIVFNLFSSTVSSPVTTLAQVKSLMGIKNTLYPATGFSNALGNGVVITSVRFSNDASDNNIIATYVKDGATGNATATLTTASTTQVADSVIQLF